ncbi:MAG: hypothetical protein M3362_02780 [Acidobacteriota bacterium]|nr:hypothetical protein [Acidobacteriota bacterium]
MVYLAFIFAFALACLAAIEFIYLMALETKTRQLRRRVAELERDRAVLTENLQRAESLLKEAEGSDEEAWPELIDDSSFR